MLCNVQQHMLDIDGRILITVNAFRGVVSSIFKSQWCRESYDCVYGSTGSGQQYLATDLSKRKRQYLENFSAPHIFKFRIDKVVFLVTYVRRRNAQMFKNIFKQLITYQFVKPGAIKPAISHNWSIPMQPSLQRQSSIIYKCFKWKSSILIKNILEGA